MNRPQEALVQLHEDTLRRRGDALRWKRYRAAVDPTRALWFAPPVILLPIATSLALLIPVWRLTPQILAGIAFLYQLGVVVVSTWCVRRREQGLLEIIRDESPALFQRLKDEHLIR